MVPGLAKSLGILWELESGSGARQGTRATNPEPQTLKFKLMGGQTSMYKPGPLVDIRSKRRDALTWYTVSFRSVSSRSNLSFGAGSGSGMSLAVLDSGCLGS